MKWLIGWILYLAVLLYQMQSGLAAPASHNAKASSELNINLVEIQDYANQYHEVIEYALDIYRSEYNRILREDGVDSALAYFNHEAGLAQDTKSEFILKLWLSTSNNCFALFTPKLDTQFSNTGSNFKACNADYDVKISTISAKILTHIKVQEALSHELQRITISEMTRSNVFTQADEMKDSLRTSLSDIDTYWRGTVEPTILTNLMTFRIDLQEATRHFNYCLQDHQIAFRNKITELKTALNECVLSEK